MGLTTFQKNLSTKGGLSLLGGKSALEKIRFVLGALGMPIPETESQFLDAHEGALIFSSHYALTLRIEREIVPSLPHLPDVERINNNPWVLRPFATFNASPFLIEICPGVLPFPQETPYAVLSSFRRGLSRSGLTFWDNQDANVGMLPLKSAAFKSGIPIVLDRLAVTVRTKGFDAIKESLNAMNLRRDPQNILYGPLQKTLKDAWPSSAKRPSRKKMKAFFRLCAEFKKAGILVAGWEGAECKDSKRGKAAHAAKAYDRLWGL